MRVWIVTKGEAFRGYHILATYSTEEKAVKAVNELLDGDECVRHGIGWKLVQKNRVWHSEGGDEIIRIVPQRAR